MTVNRRKFLQATGLAVAGASAFGCRGGASSSGNDSAGRLRFWEHNGGLREHNQRIIAQFEDSSGGVPVDYRYEPLKSFGQALQLAKQSDQMPDIHTLAGLGVPVAQLIAEGWFQPLDGGAAVDRLPADALIDGVTTFDGETYSFPIVSFRQYWAPTWFFADRVAEFDLDPDDPPQTYDEFRAACSQVKRASGGEVAGWMAKLGAANHMSAEIEDLAQAGGFPGVGGVDFRTGEYAYHADEYVDAVEFLLSLVQDELVHPASITLPGSEAQLRWAAGEAGYYFDGPWLPGIVTADMAERADQLRVAAMLVPERGMPVTVYRRPQPGMYWISADSPRGDAASRLLGEYFTTTEYFTGMARSMGQVPLILDSATDLDGVHPTYQQLLQWYAEQVYLAPSPVVQNPDVSRVEAEVKPVSPDVSATMNGLFTGELTDARRALKSLSDNLSAERERAIAAARSAGAVDVDENAWVFPHWTPRTDYTAKASAAS